MANDTCLKVQQRLLPFQISAVLNEQLWGRNGEGTGQEDDKEQPTRSRSPKFPPLQSKTKIFVSNLHFNCKEQERLKHNTAQVKKQQHLIHFTHRIATDEDSSRAVSSARNVNGNIATHTFSSQPPVHFLAHIHPYHAPTSKFNSSRLQEYRIHFPMCSYQLGSQYPTDERSR